MPNFLDSIFTQLNRAGDRVVLREVQDQSFTSVTGKELLALVQRGRGYIRKFGLTSGDRCVLLGRNSIEWIAIDLALMAEGIVVVPLYARQAIGELIGMMKDCQPSLLVVGEGDLVKGIGREWKDRPHRVSSEEMLRIAPAREPVAGGPILRESADLVTIIYTSGTSGEAKGVCLNVENVTHMLKCTTERLDQLMGLSKSPDHVFHYLPFNFAGSWILLLSCLMRESVLTLSTDLNRLADEIRVSAPNYFLNVPTRGAGVHCQAAGGDSGAVCQSGAKLAARTGRKIWPAGRHGCFVAGCRAVADFRKNKKALWQSAAGFDLRVGSAGSGDAGIFHDVGYSRAAGLRFDGNDGHLHDG